MRQWSLAVISFTLLVTLMPKASGQGNRAFTRFDETARKIVDWRVQQVTLDDYLLQLGRQGDVNVIADATNLPDPSPIISEARQKPLGSLMLEFTDAQKLTYLRQDASIFLFWHEPDVIALAKRIIAGEEVMEPITPPLDAKALSDRAMRQLITAYLTRTYGFKLQKPGFVQKIKFADLPPDLRTQLIIKLREIHLNDYLPEIATEKAWLTDDFWDQARLQTRQNTDNGKPLEILMVSGPNVNGVSTLSLGAIEDNARP